MLTGVGLIVDLLFHEVPIVAFLDHGGGHRDRAHGALDRLAIGVEHPRAPVVDGDVVALLQIADPVGERGHGQRVGADEHLAWP